MASNVVNKTLRILDALECTICLDIPASPIHGCKNGHIVCGICKDKVEVCGMCKTDLTVCATLERLSKQLEFKSSCKFVESGCNLEIISSEIREHVKTCCYRDILCPERSKHSCPKETKICMKNFPKHLEEIHFCRKYPTMTGIQIGNVIKINNNDGPYPLQIIKDKFLCHRTIDDGQLYFWITLLGNEEEAAGYDCEFIIQTQNEKSLPTCIWKLPLLPYHNYSHFVYNNKQKFAVMSISTLYDLGTKKDEEFSRFSFLINILSKEIVLPNGP